MSFAINKIIQCFSCFSVLRVPGWYQHCLKSQVHHNRTDARKITSPKSPCKEVSPPARPSNRVLTEQNPLTVFPVPAFGAEVQLECFGTPGKSLQYSNIKAQSKILRQWFFRLLGTRPECPFYFQPLFTVICKCHHFTVALLVGSEYQPAGLISVLFPEKSSKKWMLLSCAAFLQRKIFNGHHRLFYCKKGAAVYTPGLLLFRCIKRNCINTKIKIIDDGPHVMAHPFIIQCPVPGNTDP